jgi:hypothetical protein
MRGLQRPCHSKTLPAGSKDQTFQSQKFFPEWVWTWPNNLVSSKEEMKNGRLAVVGRESNVRYYPFPSFFADTAIITASSLFRPRRFASLRAAGFFY